MREEEYVHSQTTKAIIKVLEAVLNFFCGEDEAYQPGKPITPHKEYHSETWGVIMLACAGLTVLAALTAVVSHDKGLTTATAAVKLVQGGDLHANPNSRP